MDSGNYSNYLLPEFDISTLGLDSADSEQEHLHAAFELTKEVACYVNLAACSRDTRSGLKLARDQAIAAGHLARLLRLLRLTIRQVVDDHGGDQQLALMRQVIDSVAILGYLLEDGREQGGRFQSYVLDSLIAEREFLAVVHQQISQRGGSALPIENRIRQSIADTLAAAGVASIDDVPARREIGWPSAERRVERLGPAAYSAYRMGSSAIHGAFTDIEKHHWTVTSDDIEIELGPSLLRPHPLFTSSLLALDASVIYLTCYVPEALQELGRGFAGLHDRLREADSFHEAYLQRRSSG